MSFRLSVSYQNPSTAWNHHLSSFILHLSSFFIHPSSFFIILHHPSSSFIILHPTSFFILPSFRNFKAFQLVFLKSPNHLAICWSIFLVAIVWHHNQKSSSSITFFVNRLSSSSDLHFQSTFLINQLSLSINSPCQSIFFINWLSMTFRLFFLVFKGLPYNVKFPKCQ